MNTKGIKFLAVLAVMMMAFAAVIVLAPADRGTDAVTFTPDQFDPKVITGEEVDKDKHPITEFYISDDATVKVKGLKQAITIYVQNGKELVLDIREKLTASITVKTVTSDLEAYTTSTITTSSVAPWQGEVTGKTYIESTSATFTGDKGQTFVYKALMPEVKTTYDPASDPKIVVEVNAKYCYSTISSDLPLISASFGSNVTVASGQSIVVSSFLDGGEDEINYGVRFSDSSAASVTYYAPYMNAGVITADQGDEVDIASGSVTVKTKNASVKATSVGTMDYYGFKVTEQDGTVISGNIEFGTVAIDGKITVSGVTVYKDAVLKSGSNADFQGESTVTVYGQFVTKADKVMLKNITINGTGFLRLENKKVWTYDGRDPIIDFVGGFTGLIDVMSINESVDVDKGSFSTAVVAPDQTFVFTKNTTITSSVEVQGILIINPGVTVTVTETKISATESMGAAIKLTSQYSQIINYGRIIINTTAGTGPTDPVGFHMTGGYAVNYNEIKLQSNPNVGTATTFSVNFNSNAAAAKGIGFVNYGEFTVSGSDTVELTDRFVNNGEFTVSGKFADNGVAFVNNGTFTISSAKISANVDVKMSAGAVTYVKHAVFTGDKAITASTEWGGSEISIDGVTGAQIRSITITDATTLLLGEALDISGSIGVSGLTGDDHIELGFSGQIYMTQDTTISKGYELAFNGDDEHPVTLWASSDVILYEGVTCDTDNLLELYVSGSVTCVNNSDLLDDCKYTGGRYTLLSGTTIYKPINAAVDDAIEADLDLVEVGSLGAVVKSNMIVPSGLSIIGQTGAKLYIGDEYNTAVVTLADGAVFTFDNDNVIVDNGAILVANMYDLAPTKVQADVKNVNDENNTAVYMSLQYALDTPLVAGTYIALAKDFILTSGTLVIPEGVVVDATANDGTAFVLIDSDLVVNGVLMVDKFYFVATTDDTKSITVGDRIMEDNENGAYLKDKWYTPIGVSYLQTIVDDDGDENTWFVITNISKLQDAINVADDAKVTVEGSPKLGDLTITGREDMPAEVTFNGNVNAGTLTLDDVTIIAQKDKKINATFANVLGAITITGAYVKSDTMSIYTLDGGEVTMTGSIRDTDGATYSIVFTGFTGMEDAVIGWGYDDEEFPVILFNGTTTASGKKDLFMNFVDSERYSDNAGLVTVVGALIADNGTKVTIDADVEVLGSLIALERVEDKVDGSMEINGDVFVGALKSAIYDVDAAITASGEDKAFDKYNKVNNGYGKTVLVEKQSSAAAVLDGKIILGAIADKLNAQEQVVLEGKDVFITAMAGSEIDDQIVEDLDSMDVIIEDTVWVTVYGASDAKYSMDGLKAPIFNAKVNTIVDAEGKEVAKFSHEYKVIYGCGDATLSSYGIVYISLNYEAFSVTIKTDGSVKAVYIDGILMYTGENRNTFTLDKITAVKTHTVTVEPAAGYTAEGCILYTDSEDPVILPGMKFTFTEYDCEDYMVTYNIKGTQVEPEPVPPTPEEESQWTITTILLVILVVLIAIMAVIVALRLNRS